MRLSIDVIELGVPDLPAAQRSYAATFGIDERPGGGEVDLHGAATLGLKPVAALASETGVEPSASGFRGLVLNYIVAQPSEVAAVVASASAAGARVLKPAKKGFFGGFTAVVQAVDGTVWKVAAPGKKDTGPAGDPPVATEVVAILGVADPKEAKAFYEALGMTVDRDYGSKFVDFTFAPGSCRLGLMPRKDLAKDAGVDAEGSGFRATALTCRVASPGEAEELAARAAAAGADVLAPPAGESGGHHFTDPDGHLWKVVAR